MERTTVRLPPDLLARARKKAAAEGRTLTSLIEEGLRHEVDRHRRVAEEKPSADCAPISSAFGEPDSIDISSNRRLQDLMDLDVVHQGKASKPR